MDLNFLFVHFLDFVYSTFKRKNTLKRTVPNLSMHYASFLLNVHIFLFFCKRFTIIFSLCRALFLAKWCHILAFTRPSWCLAHAQSSTPVSWDYYFFIIVCLWSDPFIKQNIIRWHGSRSVPCIRIVHSHIHELIILRIPKRIFHSTDK